MKIRQYKLGLIVALTLDGNSEIGANGQCENGKIDLSKAFV